MQFVVLDGKGLFHTHIDGEDLSCELEFVFSDDKVAVRYFDGNDGCGFGHAVYASGTYIRESSEEPEFSDGDPRRGP